MNASHSASLPPQEGSNDVPLAIVGIGCRLPGGADDVESFWALLAEGRSGICEVPADRWHRERFYHPDSSVPGTMVTKWGGFVENLDLFDARFWGISPREAMRIDPQQRWLLEVCWEALENAGTPPKSLRGTSVGVFVGISSNDYAGLQLSEFAHSDVHTISGCTASIAANRISYLLDLRGPSLAVDTACSSALVATWAACRSIWSGDCASALVGGVNALIAPDLTINFSKASMCSPSGQCYTFDARANGYVRSEGASAVYIKPLAQAVAAGDRIYAVIRSAVSNQDGHTSSMTVPSADAQAELLRQAYHEAGFPPQRVAYMEAHGTGTPVGDPIEAAAIGRVLGAGRPSERPCLIGSVKTNIGHLEAGSGTAGLIKAALVLHKGAIPPNQNFETPNPHIPFGDLGLEVVTRLRPLPREDGSAPVVGVNSFGFGGANAHVVLEQAPQVESRPALPRVPRPCVLPISARSDAALRRSVDSYLGLLADPAVDLAGVCYSAGARKEQHDQRLAVVGQDAGQLRQRLTAWASQTGPVDGVVGGRVAGGAAPVFVYTGQGAQWWGMGRKLLECEPVCRAAVAGIDLLLRPLAGWSLVEELTRDEAASNIDRTDIAQPAIFALQVALTELWQSWGVRPAKVIGHSVGEVAAAYAAGIYTLADAVKVIFERSRLQHTTGGRGRMLAVGVSAAEARRAIGGAADRVHVAVLNGPALVTLAGDTASLEEVAARLEQAGRFVRWLPIAYAFHTHQMDPIKGELLQALADIRPQAARVPFVSTVTGVQLPGERLDAAYWWKNVRHPVQFAPAVAHLIRGGDETFLEVGPHPALAGSIHECLKEQGRSGAVFHSLRRTGDDQHELLTNLSGLHVRGVAIDWAAVNQSSSFVALPAYPWERESFWLESHQSRRARTAPPAHPLLGLRLPAPQPTWQGDLHPGRVPDLNDHRLWDGVVFPASGYVEIGLALSHLLFPNDAHAVEDLDIKKALFLSEELPPTVRVAFDAEASTFSVSSATGTKETWELHAQGRLVRLAARERAPLDLLALRARLTEHHDHDRFYREVVGSAYQFGPNFKLVQNIWRVPGEGVAEIVVPDAVAATLDAYHVHPAVLDACFQIFKGLDPSFTSEDFYLPVSIRRVHVLVDKLPRLLYAHGRLVECDDRSRLTDIFVYDEQGRGVLQILGFRTDRVERKQAGDTFDQCFYQFRWEPRRLRSGQVDGSCQFPESSAVVSAARSTVAELYDQRGMAEYYDQFVPRVDAAARQSVLNAWLQLGWQPRVGTRFTSGELIDRLGIAAKYHQLARAQLRELSAHGVVRRTGDETWEVTHAPQHAELGPVWDALAADYPRFATEVALHQRTAPHLAAILAGASDPMPLLFPGGSQEHLERFYVESGEFPAHAQQVRQALTRLVESLPAGRVLRVLEIGGGTGSFTRALLPVLPAEQTEYLFTDIGPAFVVAAQRAFAAYPFVEYRTADIEQEPRAGGLEPGSFDLVVGSLVLHATADLKQTLANVRSCLAPGGMMLFLEVFPRRHVWDNIFGLFDGWWRFTDRTLRRASPLLERDDWLALLADCGFRDVGSFGAAVEERQSELAFLFGFAPPADEVQGQPSAVVAAGPVVVFADGGGVADGLGARLERRGHRVVYVRAGDRFGRSGDTEFVVAPEDGSDLSRVFDELGCSTGELAGVVHCWSLDHPPAAGLALDQLWAAQPTGALSAHALVRAVAAAMPPRVWFVTRNVCRVTADDRADGLASAPLVGLLRVANNEHFPSRFALIDLEAEPAPAEIENLFHEVTAADGELEVAYRAGQRHALRLDRVPLDEVPARVSDAIRPAPAEVVPFRLQTKKPGILTNLALSETQRRAPGPDEIEIRIRAGGINFRDVMKALGMHPGTPVDLLWFGDDAAGTVERVGSNVGRLRPGDAVVGILPYAFQSHVTTVAGLVIPLPPGLSFEQAATIPTVYLTAQHALVHLARLRAGESILIHAGTGGVGQAAIQIAKRLGLEIFATASTPEKRRLLLGMGVHHAMNSRTLEFADEIMQVTSGRGVDAVLNSLAGEFIPKSLAVLAPFGRFLEIGKVDIYRNTRLGLAALKNNISYFVIDLIPLLQQPADRARVFNELNEQLAAGNFPPLPHTVFPITEAAEAFRHIAQAKHVGKVVLSFAAPRIPISPCTEPAHRFRADATYLIAGGAGGFGLELAKWLAGHGARHLVLFSRSGPRDEAARRDIEQLRAAGVTVVDARGDVTRAEDVTGIVERIREEMPRLAGVIHAAMVLDDDYLMELDRARFLTALGPKMAGAWNLHAATLGLPLEHFICLSSISAVVGTPKQSSYSAGNSFLDALAWYRRALGLPALTINWGPILGAGFVERNRKTADFLDKVGMQGFSLNETLAVFDQLVPLDPGQIAAARLDWSLVSKFAPSVGQSRTYAALVQVGVPGEGGSLLDRFRGADPGAQAGLVEDFIAAQVAGVFGVPAEKVDREAALTHLGLDSLMALELANRLERGTATALPMSSLLGGSSIKTLAPALVRLLDRDAAGERPAAPTAGAAPAAAEIGSGNDQYFQIVTADTERVAAELSFDGAALSYLPDKLVTVGGLTDAQLRELFGSEPFVINLYETFLGRIGVIMLPFRSHVLAQPDVAREPLVRALDLAGRHGARFVSLTGLIPSLTNYGTDLAGWTRDRPDCPGLTTGHATTTAAVVHNLEQILRVAGRKLEAETLTVLGLGSIGQSCLRLLLEVCPHPALILCDVYERDQVLRGFVDILRSEHGYRGPIRLAAARGSAPADVYDGSTILTAVSVPDVLDVDKLRPGTLVLDDWYPPAFSVTAGVRRLEAEGDILFSNAGMLRLPAPIRETMFVPRGGEDVLARFGVAAFREEVVRNTNELTACVLSSLLTGRPDGAFAPTIGFAGMSELVAHYRELGALGIGPARLQCDTYFVPDEAVERFGRRFGQTTETPR